MKISKRIAVLGAAAVLTAGLAACGGVTKDDATVYVKGQIDSTYLGQYNEDYLKLMDMTEAEAAEDYEWNLGAEADWFMDFASIYPSDETKEKVVPPASWTTATLPWRCWWSPWISWCNFKTPPIWTRFG